MAPTANPEGAKMRSFYYAGNLHEGITPETAAIVSYRTLIIKENYTSYIFFYFSQHLSLSLSHFLFLTVDMMSELQAELDFASMVRLVRATTCLSSSKTTFSMVLQLPGEE